MRKTVFGLMAGSAALALGACQPADSDKAMEAEVEAPAEAEDAMAETDEAMAEEGSEGDDGDDRDATGNPIGPGAPADGEAPAG